MQFLQSLIVSHSLTFSCACWTQRRTETRRVTRGWTFLTRTAATGWCSSDPLRTTWSRTSWRTSTALRYFTPASNTSSPNRSSRSARVGFCRLNPPAALGSKPPTRPFQGQQEGLKYFFLICGMILLITATNGCCQKMQVRIQNWSIFYFFKCSTKIKKAATKNLIYYWLTCRPILWLVC